MCQLKDMRLHTSRSQSKREAFPQLCLFVAPPPLSVALFYLSLFRHFVVVWVVFLGSLSRAYHPSQLTAELRDRLVAGVTTASIIIRDVYRAFNCFAAAFLKEYSAHRESSSRGVATPKASCCCVLHLLIDVIP